MSFQRKIFSAMLTAGAAFYALPSWAADAAEDADKGGLPQLNTALFPEQLFWLAISFALLYVLMAFVALPGVKRTQDNRQETIAKELAEAAAMNEQAKATITQAEKALADARAKAQTSVTSLKTAAAKESADKQAAQQKELSQRLQQAEAKITAARDAAVHEVKATATDLAQAVVEKVLGVKSGAGAR